MRRRALLGAGVAATAMAAATAWALRSDQKPAPVSTLAELRVATGPPGAVYRALGGELVKVLAERFPRSRVSEIQTGASVDNLALLANGGTELGITSLDSTVEGLSLGTPKDVTAVARLYDSWLHVVVLQESPLRTFADLDGRTVAAGAAGSGTRFTFNRLIAVAGIKPALVTATQAESVELLATGQVHAMLSLTGIPTPAVTRLAEAMPIRMIPLDSYDQTMFDRFGELYTPATVPSSAYPGVPATATLTTPNLLLARPELPADVIEIVARALFTERDRIARGHPEANRLNTRTGIATRPVRLHEGALQYFRSVKP
ncbi:MAG TPA: C4-dicarboxylate ABC transporter substrate-binding protein [Micromonosporaceae bacterium]|nr:C4-dicarboxylate ABC transporter substrate-binding protein [Micromonosporaceae bacterium]